ncbi:SET domain-containing protein [Aureococcus anophagefferens]|nr:SET domain-containing protein [Aureococcus anophagefferens]
MPFAPPAAPAVAAPAAKSPPAAAADRGGARRRGRPAPAPEAPPPPAGAGADDDDSVISDVSDAEKGQGAVGRRVAIPAGQGGGVGTVMSVGAGNMFYVRRDGDGDGEEVACHGDEIEDVAVGDERSRTEDGEESQSDPIIDRLEAGCAALAAAPVAPPPVAAPPPVVAPPARSPRPAAAATPKGAYAHIEEGSRLRERDGARECTLLSKGKGGWWIVQWDGEDQESSARPSTLVPADDDAARRRAAPAPAAPEPAAPEPSRSPRRLSGAGAGGGAAAPEPEPEPAAPEPEPEPAAPEPEPSPRRRAADDDVVMEDPAAAPAEVLEEASAQQAAAMNKDDAYAPGAPVMVLASEPKADGVVRGVVSEVQSGGWRKITLDGMSYPHESSFRPSRLVALNADNTPYEFQSPEDPLARWTPTSTAPPSEEDAPAPAPASEEPYAAAEGDRVIVIATSLPGVVRQVTANGWVKVFMDECDDDDDVESYRMAQLRPEAAPEPAAAEEPPKKKKKSAAKRTARMAELTEVLSAGRRVAILDLSPDEHPLHTPVDVTVERLGKGTITSVKGAGYRLVRYDAPLADGTVEVAAAAAASSAKGGSRAPPKYTKISRMHAAPSAKRAAKEARGSASRDAGDGAAVCECLTAVEWNSYVDAILCGEAAPRTGNGSSSRGPMGAPPQLSRAPLVRAPGESDDDARARFRREKCVGVECDGDCLNRNLQIECNPATCPMGDKCQNRCFAAKLGSKVSVEKADQCGWGLFAGEPIAKRAFVVEALGELISEEEAQERLATARANGDEDYYMLAASDAATKGLVIDATRKGNEARFANHSCDPSCRLEKWRCGSQDRYGIFALRSVKPGEQLTYDYRWASFERCYCGAANCVGVMDGVKKNPVGAAARGASRRRPRPRGGGARAAADDADLEAMEAMGENDTVGGGSASPSKKRAASGDDDGPAVAATFLGSPAAAAR